MARILILSAWLAAVLLVPACSSTPTTSRPCCPPAATPQIKPPHPPHPTHPVHPTHPDKAKPKNKCDCGAECKCVDCKCKNCPHRPLPELSAKVKDDCPITPLRIERRPDVPQVWEIKELRIAPAKE